MEMVDKITIQDLHALGLLTTEQPECVGGLALPLVTQVQIQRALSYGDLAAVEGMPGLDDGASFLRVLADYENFDQMDLINEGSTIAFINATNEEAFSTLRFEQNILSGTSIPIRSSKVATHFMIAIKNEQQEPVLILAERGEKRTEVSGTSYLGVVAASIGKVTIHSVVIAQEQMSGKRREAEDVGRTTDRRV